MTLVADESVDFGIVKGLRQKGIVVFYIPEGHGGISDSEVLRIAVDKDCLLITEDKDFGELAFRLKFPHKGILLIRLSDLPRKERLDVAVKTTSEHLRKLKNTFSVLTKNGLRVKIIK